MRRRSDIDSELNRPTVQHQASINITPFIDVLLVLIVIFLAALPLDQQGTDVDLPLRRSGGAPPSGAGALVLEYFSDGRLALNQQPVPLAGLEARLREVFSARREKTLFIAGSGALPYGEVVAVIDAAKGAGVTKIGVITDGMRAEAGVAPIG